MSDLNNLDVVGLLQEHGAFLDGHFELPSGMHSQSYVQASLMMQYPNIAHKVAIAMAAKFPQDIDVVLASSIGSVVIGQEIARVKKARAIFSEKVGGIATLRRNFKLTPGEKVLIADDVVTTGKLTSAAVSLVQSYGAKVVGVAAIVDRSTGQLPLNVPVRSLLGYPLRVYSKEECPLCKEGIPVTKVCGSNNPIK
jgi:orotate phosphoribosyltransferase